MGSTIPSLLLEQFKTENADIVGSLASTYRPASKRKMSGYEWIYIAAFILSIKNFPSCHPIYIYLYLILLLIELNFTSF